MSRRFWLAVCVLGVVAALLAFYKLAADAARGGEGAPLYSVRRFDPYGAAALYQLLQSSGVDVRLLEHSRPPGGDGPATLIQILGISAKHSVSAPAPMTAYANPTIDPQALRSWMLDGNTVVQFCAARTGLMHVCGVPHADESAALLEFWGEFERDMRSGKAPEDMYWEYLFAWFDESAADGKLHVPEDPISLLSPSALASTATTTWHPLADVDGEFTVVGLQDVGKGRLIVVSSPTPVLNGFLAEDGNLEMVLGMIGGGPVLIDEWSHGFGHGGTVVALIYRLGLLPVLAQIILVVLLFAWSTRGVQCPHREPDTRRRSSVEQVATLGRLYSQVLGPDELIRRTQQEVRRRIASALHCPISDLEKRIASLDENARNLANSALHAARIESASRPQQPQESPRCAQCGYNLFGNTSGTCPECGKKFTELDLQVQRTTTPSNQDVRTQKRVESEMRRALTESHKFLSELSVESQQRTGRRKRTRSV